jgi:acyl-coenzyme A thioesterase PaaI-like protein
VVHAAVTSVEELIERLNRNMPPATLSPPTLELKVSYIAPGAAGDYRARGRIEHMGTSIAFMASSVWDASQTLIAKATATAKLVPYRDLGRL